MSILAQNRSAVYKRFLEACANGSSPWPRTIRCPPYQERPSLDRFRSAFEAPPDRSFELSAAAPEPAGAVQGGRARSTCSSLAFPLSHGTKPFGDPAAGFPDLVEEVLGSASGRGDRSPSIPRNLLLDIGSRNALPILVIDPASSPTRWAGRRSSVIDDEKIDCGFLVILPDEAKAAENRTEWLQFGQRNKARSLAIAGSKRELQESLSRIVAELCRERWSPVPFTGRWRAKGRWRSRSCGDREGRAEG